MSVHTWKGVPTSTTKSTSRPADSARARNSGERELRAPEAPSSPNSTVPADTLLIPALALVRYHLRPESRAGAAEANSSSRWKKPPGSMRPVPRASLRRHCRPSWRALIRGTSRRWRPMVSPSASAVRRSRVTREEVKSVEARRRGGSRTAPPRMCSSGGMSGRGRRSPVTVARLSSGSSVRVAPRAGALPGSRGRTPAPPPRRPRGRRRRSGRAPSRPRTRCAVHRSRPGPRRPAPSPRCR